MESIDNLFKKLKGDNEGEKIEAIRELKNYKGEKVLQGLLTAINTHSDYVKEIIIEVLGSFKDPRVTKTFVKLTKDEDTFIRMAALEQLTNLHSEPTPELVDVFRRCLSDSHDLVRATSIESIGLLGLQSLNICLEKALNDKSPLVRAYAAFALGQIKSITSKDLLVLKLRNEKQTLVRVRYYGALFLLGEDKYFSKIIRLLKSKKFEVRSASASILGYLASNKNKFIIINTLKTALEKEEEEIVKSTISETLEHIENL